MKAIVAPSEIMLRVLLRETIINGFGFNYLKGIQIFESHTFLLISRAIILQIHLFIMLTLYDKVFDMKNKICLDLLTKDLCSIKTSCQF